MEFHWNPTLAWYSSAAERQHAPLEVVPTPPHPVPLPHLDLGPPARWELFYNVSGREAGPCPLPIISQGRRPGVQRGVVVGVGRGR